VSIIIKMQGEKIAEELKERIMNDLEKELDTFASKKIAELCVKHGKDLKVRMDEYCNPKGSTVQLNVTVTL